MQNMLFDANTSLPEYFEIYITNIEVKIDEVTITRKPVRMLETHSRNVFEVLEL